MSMSSLEIILEHIPKLTRDELNRLEQELKSHMQQKGWMMGILYKYYGRGRGTWGEDPQAYIKDLRSNERF